MPQTPPMCSSCPVPWQHLYLRHKPLCSGASSSVCTGTMGQYIPCPPRREPSTQPITQAGVFPCLAPGYLNPCSWLAGWLPKPLVHAPHALLPWGLPATSGFAIRTATTYHYRKCSVWPDPHIIATSVLVIIATLQIMGVRVVLPLTPHCSGVCLPFPTQGPSTT